MIRTNVPAFKLETSESDQTITHINGLPIPPFTFHFVTKLELGTVLLFTPTESDILRLNDSDRVHVES